MHFGDTAACSGAPPVLYPALGSTVELLLRTPTATAVPAPYRAARGVAARPVTVRLRR